MNRLVLLALTLTVSLLGCTNPPITPVTPTVAITSPSSQVYTNAEVTVLVAVTGDPTGVDLLKDGALLATLAAPYQYTWDTTGETEQTYSLTARASKPGVNAAVSNPIQVTVDRSPPFITGTLPLNAATNVWLGDELSLSFSEPVLPGSVPDATVQLKVGATVLPSTRTLDAAGTKLVLRPTSQPALPTTLSFEVNGVTDRTGNAVAPPLVRFQVPDWQQPGIQPLDVTLLNTPYTSSRSLAVDSNGHPTVAWLEGGGKANIYVKHWDGSVWTQLGSGSLNINPDKQSSPPVLALDSSGNPTVTWNESDGTLWHIYVKRWSGATWAQVGPTFLTANVTGDTPTLALDASGKPTVAWREFDAPTKSSNLYVTHWDGVVWAKIGDALDVNVLQNVLEPALAMGANGKPIVAWREQTNASFDRLYVKRWNGLAWTQLGESLNVNNQVALTPSLATDSGGDPTVAWGESDAKSSNVYVKHWNGSAWTQVGTLLDANADKNSGTPSLAIGPDNNATVAWLEQNPSRNNQPTIYVKRWSGSAWAQVGSTSLFVTGSFMTAPSLALDSIGQPMTAWTDADGGSQNLYVQRFNHVP